MAFTESELVSIVKIVGIGRIDLNQALATYDSYISSEVESAVRNEIVRWDDAGENFTSIEPKESNKGVRIDAGSAKTDIRENLVNLLFLSDYVVNVSSAQGVLIRG